MLHAIFTVASDSEVNKPTIQLFDSHQSHLLYQSCHLLLIYLSLIMFKQLMHLQDGFTPPPFFMHLHTARCLLAHASTQHEIQSLLDPCHIHWSIADNFKITFHHFPVDSDKDKSMVLITHTTRIALYN